jgi:DNA polymerase-3 subunit delta'
MASVLSDSTEHQPRAQMALRAALASGPSHAYLFRGPRGAGKRAAARAFAAEILAAAADDPDDTRRRALLDPSPHPDLVWLAPSGAQHLVEEVRERVIRAAAYRPFEGGRRVFVLEAAEAMRDESQNALLKTLEEPPAFAHLILISSEPAGLLETIASRCQPVDFAPLPVEAVEDALNGGAAGVGEISGTESVAAESATGAGGEIAGLEGGGGPDAEEIAAVARLAAGDVELARFLLGERGREVRAQAERLAAAALASGSAEGGDRSASSSVDPAGTSTGEPHGMSTATAAGSPATESGGPPWRPLLKAAERAGEDAEAAAREALEAEKEAGAKRSAREIGEEAKRAGRRRRTELLDLALGLTAAWFRDLAAVAAGATDLVYNRDRLAQLRSQAAGLDPSRPRRAAELVQDTRRRLDLNVSEELALEALLVRLQRLLQ